MTEVLAIPSVSICLNLCLPRSDRRLTVAEDGYLGMFYPPAQFMIDLELRRGAYCSVFEVDGKKNIQLKQDWCGYLEEIPLRSYQKFVSIKTNDQGAYFTHYPENNVRIVQATEQGMVLFEVSIIAQKNKFYFCKQQTHTIRCYCKEGMICCPDYQRWPQISQLANQIYQGQAKDLLPDISVFQPLQGLSNNGLKPKQGRVVWFNFAQGYGALQTPKGMARIHWSEIIAPTRQRAYLQANDVVEFEQLKTPPVNGKRETSFQLEAYRVKKL